MSFEGYTGHIAFNESGERVNYTLNIHQVTMNKLPRNVIDQEHCAGFVLCFSIGGKFYA